MRGKRILRIIAIFAVAGFVAGVPINAPTGQPTSAPTASLRQCSTGSVCSSNPTDSVLTTNPNTCFSACPSGTLFVQILDISPAFTGCLCFSSCPLEPLTFGDSTIFAVKGEACPTFPPSLVPTIAPTSTTSVFCESGFICNSLTIGVVLTLSPQNCASECELQNGDSNYFDFVAIPPIFFGCLCHETCPLVPAPSGVVNSEVSAINGAPCPVVTATPSVQPSFRPPTRTPPSTPKPKAPTEPPSKPKPPSEPSCDHSDA